MKAYKKLVLWQEGKNLVVLVYKLTGKFPKSEEYGLKSQMRRASVSTLANIAEGWLRRSAKDKLRYLEISEGSLLELETEGEVALAVGFWTKLQYERFDKQRSRVGYLPYRYKSKIQSSL